MHPYLDCGLGHSHLPGRFLDRQTFQLHMDDWHPLLFGQLIKKLHDVPLGLRRFEIGVGKQLTLNRPGFRGGWLV
jgi:hypothetical protein